MINFLADAFNKFDNWKKEQERLKRKIQRDLQKKVAKTAPPNEQHLPRAEQIRRAKARGEEWINPEGEDDGESLRDVWEIGFGSYEREYDFDRGK